MFTVQEVAEFVRGTLGSMPSTVHIGQSMDVVKLQSIARTVDSRLFSFPGAIMFSAASWLSPPQEREAAARCFLKSALQILACVQYQCSSVASTSSTFCYSRVVVRRHYRQNSERLIQISNMS